MMKQPTKLSIILLSYMAELAGFYPLYFLLGQLLKTPFHEVLPLWAAAVLGLAAIGFNLLLAARSVRVLFLWLINLVAGVGLSYLMSIWLQSTVITFSGFIRELQPGSDQLLLTARLWVLLFLIGVMVIRAMSIVNRTIDYQQATHRFEVCTGALFTGLLLFNLLSFYPRPIYIALGLCLLANIGALALSRSPSSKPFLLGPALTVYGIMIVSVGWLLTCLLPVMTRASKWVWGTTAPTIKVLATKLFRWLFNYDNARGDSGNLVNQTSQAVGSGWDAAARNPAPEWLQHLAAIFVGAAVGIGILALAALLFYILTRLWYRKNPTRLLKYSSDEKEGLFRNLTHILIRLFIKVNLWLQPLRVGRMDITELYRCLLIWGSLRHQPRQIDETPFEYGRRLSTQFPKQREEITLLTASYVGWHYGQRDPDNQHLMQIRTSLRQLYY